MIRLKALAGATLLCITLSACSMVGFSYKHMDWWLMWKIDDALNLTSEQKDLLEPQLHTLLNWHCSAELPNAISWLEQNQLLLEQSTPSSEAIRAQIDQVDTAFKRIARQVTPTATQLLGGLSDQQVTHLYAFLKEQNQEDREEFLDPPLATQITERSTRMQERLEPWFGQLSASQIKRIDSWSADLGEQNRIWLENREAWQSALRSALKIRNTQAFAARLRPLIESREDFYTKDYKQANPKAQMALAALLGDLVGQASEEQHEQISKRLDKLQAQLAQQVCIPAAP
ncbi:DUF6279 family lipoprotein [Pseudomonas segetis]|uniref:Lipoprotein n=1 Tax=Pseudomonas segetis TaxID=298908 RepID=A0A238ZB06_9PSED|nr:DUF6279 family lipoprotein [Pseudomonas segetis]SNR80262.1 hypothetical protein SAMN05216255_0271 [Pseudomonas segetis]